MEANVKPIKPGLFEWSGPVVSVQTTVPDFKKQMEAAKIEHEDMKFRTRRESTQIMGVPEGPGRSSHHTVC